MHCTCLHQWDVTAPHITILQTLCHQCLCGVSSKFVLPALLITLSVGCCCLQHVDTGELLMQAYADRAALSETLQTK
jgi:hypothetical protein